MIALAALALATAALPPQAIELPPAQYRVAPASNPDVDILFVENPAGVCRAAPEGYVTHACTLGKRPNKVITVLPIPCDFPGEKFAALICRDYERGVAPIVNARGLEVACSPAFRFEVFARLTCHEGMGHQVYALVHPAGKVRGWRTQP